MSYAKVFDSLLDSSVWQEPLATKIVWVTILVMANQDGEIHASLLGLAKRSGVTLDECRQALLTFLSPDEFSSSPEEEGRRIRAIDGGWELINHDKYKHKLSIEDRRERTRKRVEKHRARQAPVTPEALQSVTVTPSNACNDMIYSTSTSASVLDRSSGVPSRVGVPGGVAPPLSAPPPSPVADPVVRLEYPRAPELDDPFDFEEPTRVDVPIPFAGQPEAPPESVVRRSEPPPALPPGKLNARRPGATSAGARTLLQRDAEDWIHGTGRKLTVRERRGGDARTWPEVKFLLDLDCEFTGAEFPASDNERRVTRILERFAEGLTPERLERVYRASACHPGFWRGKGIHAVLKDASNFHEIENPKRSSAREDELASRFERDVDRIRIAAERDAAGIPPVDPWAELHALNTR